MTIHDEYRAKHTKSAALWERSRQSIPGGITHDSIEAIAATGVDYASSGALTHSAPALDTGLDIEM